MNTSAHSAQPAAADVITYAINPDLFQPLDEISDMTTCPPNTVLAEMRKSVTTACAVMKRASIDLWKSASDSAQYSLENARRRLADYQHRLEKATAILDRMPHVNLVMFLVCAVAAPLGVGADIAATFSVLPRLLNIPMNSWLAMGVGAIPLIGTVAVKLAFDWLFHAIASGLARPEGSWPYRFAIAFDALLHVAIFGANIAMAVYLAMGRQEAFRVFETLSDPNSVPELNPHVINALLVAVGIVAMLDSALALGKLARLCEDLRHRYVARRDEDALRNNVETASREVAEATARQASAQHCWDEREEKGAELKAAFEQKYFTKIAQVEALKADKPKSRAELIAAILAPSAQPLAVNQQMN